MVRGTVGVMVGVEDVAVPFVTNVDDGRVDEPVSMGTGITVAPDVLSEYEPVDIPVPVMTAVPLALDEARDEAALDKIPENSEEREEETAGLVATTLESWELSVDAISDSAPELETLMLDGSKPVTKGSSKPPDSVVVAFGALVTVGWAVTGAEPTEEVYPVPGKVALAKLLDVVESGRSPVSRGSRSPPDSEVVVGEALLEVLSMIVDRPTNTGPLEVFVGVPVGISVLAGAVGDTSLTGTPPLPVG